MNNDLTGKINHSQKASPRIVQSLEDTKYMKSYNRVTIKYPHLWPKSLSLLTPAQPRHLQMFLPVTLLQPQGLRNTLSVTHSLLHRLPRRAWV